MEAKPWSQFLRRITTYACLAFGTVTPGNVTNDECLSYDDDEWLRLWSHVSRIGNLAQRGAFPTTASMLVLTDRYDLDAARAQSSGSASSGGPSDVHIDMPRLKKEIVNPMACKIINDPKIQKVKDDLALSSEVVAHF